MSMLKNQARPVYTLQMRPSQRYRIWLALNWQRGLDSWRVYSQNRLAVFGLVLILIYALMAVAHPILIGNIWSKRVYDPHTGYDLKIYPHPAPPSAEHWLGTDSLGRDVLSRLLAATAPTYILALTAAVTTALISILMGAFAAYWGGVVDIALAHLSDLALLAPAPLVMVVVGGTIDISPVKFGLLYGLITGTGGAAIIMRAQALSLMRKPYLEASRVAGAGGLHIIFHHLLPNMLPLAAVQMLMSVTGAVFADGFSTFLGLSRTRLNWGSMVYDSFTYQAVNSTITWNVLISAALAISLFASAFYFIARGMHDIAAPDLRTR